MKMMKNAPKTQKTQKVQGTRQETSRRVPCFVLGRDIKLGPELAVGGEGRIYAISELVASNKGKTSSNEISFALRRQDFSQTRR